MLDTAAAYELTARAGIHTGEIELQGGDVRGIAVHAAARILAIAEPGEVLVSGTVRDLLAGSGLEFRDRGEFELRGLEGRRILAALVR
jgi:class 3 adenylate cyclase